MYNSEEGETGESSSVLYTFATPASPAFPAINEAGVCEQEKEGCPVGDAGSKGGAEESHIKGVDE